MSNKVGFTAVSEDLTFADTIATLHGNPAYCGSRTYSFSPTYSFLTITGTTMNLETSNVADVGPHNVAVTISLTDYPNIKITKNLTVTITCEV